MVKAIQPEDCVLAQVSDWRRTDSETFNKTMDLLLARNIIGEHFGPVVLPVAEVLIRRYPAPLSLTSLIALAAPVPASTVRRALLLFLRHNVLQISSKPSDDKLPSPPLYALKISAIITRIQFSTYAIQARELFGEVVSHFNLCS
jgi:hypothetical protein